MPFLLWNFRGTVTTGNHTSEVHIRNTYCVEILFWGKVIYNILYYITSISILGTFKHYQYEQRRYLFESQKLRNNQKQHLAYYHASDVRIQLITVPSWVLRNYSVEKRGYNLIELLWFSYLHRSDFVR